MVGETVGSETGYVEVVFRLLMSNSEFDIHNFLQN
jgi:hypothetical protein